MRPRALTNQSDLPRGFAVGRHLVLDRVGTGVQSAVYTAYDPERGRKVALKVFHQDGSLVANRKERRSQLLRAAQILARLSHPQLLSIYEIGTLGEQVFIAMEFVDGLTLPNWLRQQSRSQQDILDVFILAGRGLAAAHKAGLFHAKFEPDNILITPRGQVYVNILNLDDEPPISEACSAPEQLKFNFELAVDSSHVQSKALCCPRFSRYEAPEQYAAKPVEIRTDLFNFCAALYETCYGAPPFSGNTLAEYLVNVQSGNLSPVPAGSRSPPGWLRHALLLGLSAEPDRRHASMDVLLTKLSRQKYHRRRWWLCSGAAVALGALLLLAWYISILVKRQQLRCSGAPAAGLGSCAPRRTHGPGSSCGRWTGR